MRGSARRRRSQRRQSRREPQGERRPVARQRQHLAGQRENDLHREVFTSTERAANLEITDEDSLRAVAESIRAQLDCRNVLITRGEHGMCVLDAIRPKIEESVLPAMAA